MNAIDRLSVAALRLGTITAAIDEMLIYIVRHGETNENRYHEQ